VPGNEEAADHLGEDGQRVRAVQNLMRSEGMLGNHGYVASFTG
jgi:hypothetical protein